MCLATLGPGAINLMLGVANAQLDSHPLVAIAAQAGLDRIYKESHQFVDLVSLFRPITKWGDMITVRAAAPEMVRKAFKQATTERPGATFLDRARGRRRAHGRRRAAEGEHAASTPRPTTARCTAPCTCSSEATHPVVLAGPGVARDDATEALIRFSERLNIPVATTFLGKGVFPDDHPNALGTIGFMVKDYANFGFDRADVVVAVGYDLVEYSPARWNPDRDKQIVHIHRTVAEVDAHYTLAVGVQGNIGETLDAIGAASYIHEIRGEVPPVRDLVREELERGAADDAFPMAPARIVADVRAAMGREDIVLRRHRRREDVDGPPVPDVPPRHLPDLERPRDDGVLPARGDRREDGRIPERKVLAAMGDGAFAMSMAEIETAVREGVHITILVWVDGGYGLIGWKQDIHFGRQAAVSFTNPDFVMLAESFGAKGYAIEAAEQLAPTLAASPGRRGRQRDRVPGRLPRRTPA